MNLELLFGIPMVYTTRLEDMTILRKDLSIARPKDIIKGIIYESKPQFKVTVPNNGAKILKNKHNKSHKAAKKYKKNYCVLSEHVQRSPNFKLTFKELKSKLDFIKYKTKNSVDEPEVVIKNDIETFEEFESKLDVMESETNSAEKQTKVVIKSEIETFEEHESKLDVMESETNSAEKQNKVVIKSEIETFEEHESKLDVMESETNSAEKQTKVVIKSEIETFEEHESKLDVMESETNSAEKQTKVVIKSEIETFEEHESKLDVIESETNNTEKQTKVVIKSEIETDIKSKRVNKLESLLALCRPLKIVLNDINKILPKINNEIKSEILNISSDSDDDVILIEQNKVCPISKIVMKGGKSLINPTANYIINNKTDFKNVLKEQDLQDSVIVIYNLFRKELDAYQIDECCKVTEYKIRKYDEVNKFPMKKCKLIINIIACCWKKRQCFISLLMEYDKYISIVRFISTTHLCTELCTCCCVLELNTQPQDGINKLIENDTVATNSLVKKPHTCRQKFIALALKYEKNSKWKGYPEVTSELNVKNKRICKRLLQFNNINGEAEFYEFGRDNIIYSKIVKDAADETSWLYNTMTPCINRSNITFTDPFDREKIILHYRYISDIISYETECFLRNPFPIKGFKKTNHCAERDKIKKYIVRHIRSFTGASYKKSQVISIVSETSKPHPPSCPVGKSKPSSSSQSGTRKPRGPRPKRNIMDENVSETVNHLVKDILHRFRDVLLTINPDGKVAAALNAPLSTLSQSELKILSQILNHAQSQVDKLGLTPGTCLNPDAPMETNSTGETSTISIETTDLSAVDATNSENSVDHKNQSSEEKSNKKENKKILSSFSTIIANKKKDYEMSFRSFLGDTVEPTPNITNVFSLNVGNCVTSNVLENRFKDNAVMVESDDVSSMENPKIFINEMGETTIVDNTVSTRPNKRKRKTTLKCNKKQPKIRVKAAAEILVENSAPVDTPFVSRNIEIVECDSLPSVALTPIDISDANNVPDNIPLQHSKADLETLEVLPRRDTETVSQSFFIVQADGKMSNNRIFLNP